MRERYCHLRLEELEDRTAPVVYGNPWLDARHLTLSFVPDGTRVGNQSSQLFQYLNNQIGSAAAWETEILRAVQTWTSVINADVGVVADGGQALGVSGQIHGDPRFGDIRIAAVPMGGSGIAIATPFDPTAGTLAGDIIINSAYPFQIGAGNRYDLYTIMLHEVGHVLGIDETTDPGSPMGARYTGVRSGIDANDVALIQALYTARLPDAHELLSTSGGGRPSCPSWILRAATPPRWSKAS